MWATLTLCQAFSAFCISNNNSYSRMKKLGMLKVNSVFNPRSKNEMITALEEFTELVDLDLYALDVLRDIINFSPSVKLKEHYIFSHLRSMPNHWKRGEYTPPVITANVKEPDFVDIHILDNQQNAPVEAQAEPPRPNRQARRGRPEVRLVGNDAIGNNIDIGNDARIRVQEQMEQLNLDEEGQPVIVRRDAELPVWEEGFNNDNNEEDNEED